MQLAPRLNIFFVALVLLATHGVSQAAGITRLQVPAAGSDPAINIIVWSPCATAPGNMQMGPFELRGTADCAVSGSALPLVVVSHGHLGNYLGHRDTALALAEAGFVAVSLIHPGDTFGDDSGAHELPIFESRPRDVSRVISFMLERWQYRNQLNPNAIGVFGFSRGGYTA
jgi:predicted dienelactone hydrolase